MKKALLLPGFLIISFSSFAQSGIADNWYFGVLCGMKFSSTVNVAIPSSIVTNEGSSGISDSSGSPLFYTNGVTVWNRLNQVMPNGTGLNGDESSTQSALIVPSPANASQYYVFTVDEIGGPNGFCYSIVDMTLNGGMGDVSVKNTFVLGNVTEKLTAVEQTESPGSYWIAVHENNSNAFYVYPLVPAGLMPPVISNAGIVHSNAIIQNTYGQMKFSPCGDKIALAAGYLDTVEVFDFNSLTGVVSNPITLPSTDHVYGLEFSQNGSLLYVSTYDPLATLIQYDLSSQNPVTIISSLTVLSSTPDIYGLQLANDSKIYVCKSFSIFLGSIDFPDVPGIGCTYNDNSIFLDPNATGASAALSLPGFVQSAFRNPASCIITAAAEYEETNFYIYPNPSNTGFIINEFEGILFIYDETGRMIGEFTGAGQSSLTFGNDIYPGIYTGIIKNKQEERHFRFIKM